MPSLPTPFVGTQSWLLECSWFELWEVIVNVSLNDGNRESVPYGLLALNLERANIFA